MPQEEQIMIEAERLSKTFGNFVAVRDVSLRVKAGGMLALLGPNGAGKTTTVRMLSGILIPTSGRARIANLDVVTHAAEIRRRVGVLTELPGLYLRSTAREYLDFFGSVYGLSKTDRRARIIDLMAQFEMSDVLDRRLSEFSKGMRQKLALIRTMLHDPEVLLLDEPTSAMDPQSARLVHDAAAAARSTSAQHRVVHAQSGGSRNDGRSHRHHPARADRAEGSPAELKAHCSASR
jgi:ABC-2 type transport system ATP-binding protein